jgi:hypothetical protein
MHLKKAQQLSKNIACFLVTNRECKIEFIHLLHIFERLPNEAPMPNIVVFIGHERWFKDIYQQNGHPRFDGFSKWGMVLQTQVAFKPNYVYLWSGQGC